MSYYQCTKCGEIIPLKKKLKLEDDMYANWICDECGHSRLLYLCDNIDDIYIYADVILDERYFNYGNNNTKL